MKEQKVDTRTYEQKREEAISKFRGIYKDSIAFDRCMLDKSTRTLLLQDEVYLSQTRAMKADMYYEQITVIDDVIEDVRSDKDNSSTRLKALEMKQKLLFQDMMIDADESNALNITFTAMDREAFEKMETVEIFKGNAKTADLSAMKAEGEELSPEERMKEKINETMKKNTKE